MTLTAIVGALLALVARPELREQKEVDRLRRSNAQLIDRVETLERDNESLSRELANERNLSTHWIAEASRIARQAREDREQLMRLYSPQQQILGQGAQQALQQALQQRAQQNALLQQNYQLAQQQQQALQQQLAAQQQSVGFCNCVPSRHQMFDAMAQVDGLIAEVGSMVHGAVLRLNREG